ncbi:MAG TPA: GIY-YIG nuclease family protein [Caulobacteraceae bacterium]|nr:GIY-YIG nuclease family protein [Caulobacteraceae bacterium]
MAFFVYIMASRRNGTLYVGMTDDLSGRVAVHRGGDMPGFVRKYGVTRLVWFEAHPTRESAFLRERRIKKWNRDWKLALIERDNPDWNDLFEAQIEVGVAAFQP